MPSYRLSFINEIPEAERCSIAVSARSSSTLRNPERAVEAAKTRFARLEGICNWNIHAGRIEFEPINLPKIRPSAEAKDAEHKGTQQ
ncbi:MAG: hypothetical protein JO320_00600 [Alphaproteobacteria bacterium]|nr:hypothetical protein [Alphaproteobacteria bacterium]MBV9373561.1 hypothetical protein [Alphaproteobacteria bacterium]